MVKVPHWPIPLGAKPIDLGLERVLALLERLGNPHKKLPPVVHIAGTNGKGSTLAFLKSILEAAGYKVHRYTSPHLVAFNERIELAGKPITDEYLYTILERCREQTEGLNITFFEGTTVAALLAFAEMPADIVLLETGMGGRLDATNVIDSPRLTLLTPIAMDHMEFLGETLAAIAAEKAAIMKSGVPCITAPQTPEAMRVIEAEAERKHSSLTIVDSGLRRDDVLGLAGKHQYINAALAAACIPYLTGFAITPEHIVTGLQNARWPARLQPIRYHGKDLWLDGGHNPAGGRAIAEWAKDKAPITLICGMMGRKDIEGFLSPLAPYCAEVIAIPVPGEPDSAKPEEIAAAARKLDIPATVAASAKEAAAQANGTTLIAGSLYLAGSVLAEIG